MPLHARPVPLLVDGYGRADTWRQCLLCLLCQHAIAGRDLCYATRGPNAMCQACVARWGTDVCAEQQVVQSFPALKHGWNRVGDSHGNRFVNGDYFVGGPPARPEPSVHKRRCECIIV